MSRVFVFLVVCLLPLANSFMVPRASTLQQRNSPFHQITHVPSSSVTTVKAMDVSISSEASSLDPMLLDPVFWSTCIMLSIVGLLYTWEETVKLFRKKLPRTLMPVVDSMLAEMGGLGFIGLFLSIFVTGGPVGQVAGQLSEEYLGNEEILLETFKFLHTAFFEVGIGFFFISGLTVLKVLKKIESLTNVSETIESQSMADGSCCLRTIADVLEVDCLTVDANNDGELSEEEIKEAVRSASTPSILEEAFMSTQQVKAEALVVRERFMKTIDLAPSFRIETYFEKVFGENLREIVELSPFAWLPLIPPISVGRSVDMSRGVICASSPNAADAVGYFLGRPIFMREVIVAWCLGIVWCFWNFWKMTSMKYMLVPTLVVDASSGQATILPPRYEDEVLLEQFNSSPFPFNVIEGLLSGSSSIEERPAASPHQKVFGAAGKQGPRIFRNSIKLHTWFIVTQIVFFGGQILSRDIEAFSAHWSVGNPTLLEPELITFGILVLGAIAQLWLAPQTFLNYCLVTSIEEFAEEALVREACLSAPRSTLAPGSTLEETSEMQAF